MPCTQQAVPLRQSKQLFIPSDLWKQIAFAEVGAAWYLTDAPTHHLLRGRSWAGELSSAMLSAPSPGHVLSMPHDDSKNCERLFGPLGEHHVMAALFVHLNKTQPWSPCSAMYLTEFLDGGHGKAQSATSSLKSTFSLIAQALCNAGRGVWGEGGIKPDHGQRCGVPAWCSQWCQALTDPPPA